MDLLAMREAIMLDGENAAYTEAGVEPLFQASSTSRLILIGQAPGFQAQERGRLFDDPSGENLRSWLGLSRELFYDSEQIAILPMDFYFPGRGKTGDLPPRKGFAAKWHAPIIQSLPAERLTLLIGAYAQAYYLPPIHQNVTERVRHYEIYLPDAIPLPHPSPRNAIWQANNPWFQERVLPDVRRRVARLLMESNKKG